MLGDSCLAPVKLTTHRNIVHKNNYRYGRYYSAFGDNLKDVVFCDECTSIGDSLFFYCRGLKTVDISDNVKSIGNCVFKGCTELISVNIPSGVTSIGVNSFYGCSGLTLITIPSGVTSIGVSAFYGCSGLTSITIPSSVTSIGEGAFYGCSGLTSINILPGVTSIGSSAFSGCRGLTSINIPSGVTFIGGSVFEGCSGLTSITIPSGVTSIGGSAFKGCSSLVSFDIPSKVTSIGASAFKGCPGPVSITIPSSVVSIGRSAFYCQNLTKVRIEEGPAPLQGDYYCFPYVKEAVINRSTSGGVFSNDFKEQPSALENVSIGNGCTSIGEYLFTGCTRLTSINLPNSITSIEGNAFRFCTGLTSISIPPKVKTIDGRFVNLCANLENITFEGPVPQIISEGDNSTSEELFERCDKLSSVSLSTGEGWKNLPKDQFVKVTFLNDYVEPDVTYWKEWTKLEYIVSFSAIPPKIGDSFSEFQKWNIRVRVPSSSLAAYQNAPVWKNFYFLNGGAETLGIEDVNVMQERNDPKHEPVYDMNGRQVPRLVPGHIYVKNGRKFLAK